MPDPARTALRLRRDVAVGQPDVATTDITGPLHHLRVSGLRPGVHAVLADLARDAYGLRELTARVDAADLPRLRQILAHLDALGLLEHTLLLDGGPLLTLRPVGSGRTVWRPAPDPAKLSRFALVHAQGGRLTVSAPDSPLALDLAPAATGLLGTLADWAPAAALPAEALRFFATAGVLAPGSPGADPETDEQPLAQWQLHDRWLHARSRGPTLTAGYGGTYRHAGRFPPLPAEPPPRGTRRLALARPDRAAVAARDPALGDVLESRRSVRGHDDADPLTADRLGELLYRTARRVRLFAGEHGQQLAARPYPGAGAVHELELYPLVTRCEGVDPGLWHYRSGAHELERVAEPGPETSALVDCARTATVMAADPQVVLLVSARFGRVMWKYETIAYALTLKDVGALYQTVYLVGTAMGLAVCATGVGDASLFATATGLDPAVEGSVGELVVGSRLA